MSCTLIITRLRIVNRTLIVCSCRPAAREGRHFHEWTAPASNPLDPRGWDFWQSARAVISDVIAVTRLVRGTSGGGFRFYEWSESSFPSIWGCERYRTLCSGVFLIPRTSKPLSGYFRSQWQTPFMGCNPLRPVSAHFCKFWRYIEPDRLQ